MTPLHVYCLKGQLRLVEYLVSQEVEINARDRSSFWLSIT